MNHPHFNETGRKLRSSTLSKREIYQINDQRSKDSCSLLCKETDFISSVEECMENNKTSKSKGKIKRSQCLPRRNIKKQKLGRDYNSGDISYCNNIVEEKSSSFLNYNDDKNKSIRKRNIKKSVKELKRRNESPCSSGNNQLKCENSKHISKLFPIFNVSPHLNCQSSLQQRNLMNTTVQMVKRKYNKRKKSVCISSGKSICIFSELPSAKRKKLLNLDQSKKTESHLNSPCDRKLRKKSEGVNIIGTESPDCGIKPITKSIRKKHLEVNILDSKTSSQSGSLKNEKNDLSKITLKNFFKQSASDNKKLDLSTGKALKFFPIFSASNSCSLNNSNKKKICKEDNEDKNFDNDILEIVVNNSNKKTYKKGTRHSEINGEWSQRTDIVPKHEVKSDISVNNILSCKRTRKKSIVIHDESSGDQEIKENVGKSVKTNLKSNEINESAHDKIEKLVIKELIVQTKENKDKTNNIFIESNIIVNKTPVFTEPINFSFPVFSHICSSGEVTFSSTCVVPIQSEILDKEVDLPQWNHVIGLIDKDCIKKIKEHQNIKNIISISSSNNNISNEECNEMLWIDLNDKLSVIEKSNKYIVDEMRSWLLQWKSKFGKIKEQNEDSIDSFSSDDSESLDNLPNSIIIFGSSGCGKTSLIFSLASELGFKVLEVNASSCRSGRNISLQLKEALESYHVENVKVSNMELENNSNSTTALSQNLNSPDKNFKSSMKKDIKTFFSVDKTTKGDVKKVEKHNEENCLLPKLQQPISNFFQRNKRNSASSQNKLLTESNPSEMLQNKDKKERNTCKMSSLTIILFDDVDIIFDEDEGFWSTVRGFLKISKKPVVFTVSRNLDVVKSNLTPDIEVFTLKSPLGCIAVDKLSMQCDIMKRSSTLNFPLLASHNANDLRRSCHQAQFWSQKSDYILKDSLSLNNQISSISHKPRNANAFLLGSLDFSVDCMNQLIYCQDQSNILDIISEYYKMGFDLLYNNVFSLLKICDMKDSNLWDTVIQKSVATTECSNLSHLWQEACNIFKLKQEALQNGSPSKDLFLISSLINDFSFSDSLKGQLCKNINWTSVLERINKWTAGLPMCYDLNFGTYEDLMSDMISLIQIYKLRNNLNTFRKVDSGNNCENIQLLLQYPFTNQSYLGFEAKEQINFLIHALPTIQHLNISALSLDYLSTLKIMCSNEINRQVKNNKRSGRFLHYFDSISLYIDRDKIMKC